MDTIKLNYKELEIHKQDIATQIEVLIKLADEMENKCNKLQEVWKGHLSSKFQNKIAEDRKSIEAIKNNIDITNKFKNTVISVFKNTEDDNSRMYKG